MGAWGGGVLNSGWEYSIRFITQIIYF